MALSTQRLPIIRTELSGSFDSGETAQLLSIRYIPGSATNEFRPGSGNEDYETEAPLIIYDYKVEFATDTLAQVYQTYCHYDATPGELAAYLDWNTSSKSFLMSLKQHKFIAGNTNAYFNTNTNTTVTKSQFKQTTLNYRAKGYWSKKHKEWRWTRPPIILSKNRKNYFAIQCANVGNSSQRSYFATVTIKKYAQIF